MGGKPEKLARAIPGGFVLTRAGEWFCVCPESAASEVVSASRAYLAGAGVSLGTGRGTVRAVVAAGREMVFRRYLHGGIFRGLTGDRFLGPGRFLDELEVSLAAVRGGARVPEPLGLLLKKARLCWRGALITGRIARASDLAAFLAGTSPDPGRLRRVLEAVASAAAGLHGAGIRHRDFHLKNILLEETGGEFRAWIIDLDRADRCPPGSRAARADNLGRLRRSWFKLKQENPELPRVSCGRFLLLYAGGDRREARALAAAAAGSGLFLRLRLLSWRLRKRLGLRIYARPRPDPGVSPGASS